MPLMDCGAMPRRRPDTWRANATKRNAADGAPTPAAAVTARKLEQQEGSLGSLVQPGTVVIDVRVA